ncbi:glycine zipper 2TM domain-containing protein [Hephaestia mangrovi]|uniref:glycine zipper 2TM domain-containing protein n=1 Tax=Hephaestia mangrovi TaxID=2873268 RepID=UPI001CA6920E|nr:glycine zipper 2TM domain-containing protein [Hephaestia mangrovi]MBY8828081.1 glycine zipper 2TM domain-containing protein [Hephaestia mangrovi]
MKNAILAIGIAAVAMPAAAVLPATSAVAQHHYRHHQRHYAYKEWRGRDGRRYCRKSDGTVGTVVGGVAGALLGRTVDTHGDRTTGTVLGAAGGALVGHALDSKTHCR